MGLQPLVLGGVGLGTTAYSVRGQETPHTGVWGLAGWSCDVTSPEGGVLIADSS